ncbi:MAG: indole-3-glycerol phosphate synthase TrpC [Anaerolineae bacterium]|nr:indole-3-glycerol phosphate synthase TrpC [Anaerolineae bacterium]
MSRIAGLVQTGTILDRIIAHKRDEVAAAQAQVPLADLQAQLSNLPSPRDFRVALQREQIALIAEVKHASPSKGVLIEDFEPVALARFYAEHGTAAISILTDEQFFQGHLDHLRAIREVVELPLLRKDFTIDPYQLYEARAAGADAILLIVAALEDALLADLHGLATELGLAALVEVHSAAEMARALALPAPLIGINNRNLHDFSVDLGITRGLAQHVPPSVTLVGESGIRTADDVRALGRVDAILVGETIVRATDRTAVMQALSSVPSTRQEVL